MKKIALSIAGSDSSGAAGIQADLKSFSFLGLHGITVLTCVTSQSTQRVKTVYKIPVEIIEDQIDTLFEDFEIDSVKTGMLYDDEIVKCVSKKILEYKLKPVVDPVMIATSGDLLSKNTLIHSLKKYLLPKALMITANIPEAYELTNIKINTIEDIKKACQEIASFGPKYVLIKGGHFKNENAIDILYYGKLFHNFSLPRIQNKKAHGSGCTLSALISGLIAKGETPLEAVRKAKYFVWDMIKNGYLPGKGSDVLNHSFDIQSAPHLPGKKYYEVWFELKNAVEKLTLILPITFIPEVGINFAYALENAKDLKNICAINGRIFKDKNRARICGSIDFGTSKHVASIVLAAMSFDGNIRSALNIRFSSENLNMCEKADFKLGYFNRKDEPKEFISTMEWGTKEAISKLGFVPDVIYDHGGIGKEPMIRVLGRNPSDVLSKLNKIIKI